MSRSRERARCGVAGGAEPTARSRRGWWCALGALAALLLAVGACDRLGGAPQEPPAAPSPELAQRAVSALLPGLQFGPDPAQHTYREIRGVEVAGSHFVPALNRWTVHYCVDFVSFANEAPQRRCDQAVDVYQLDSKKWVGFARGAGTLYRWRLLDETPSANGAASSPAPPTGDEHAAER